MNPLHLPDVSYSQPDVEWAEVVKHNGGAAIINATEGLHLVDTMWQKGRRRSAHAHGVKVLGIYHYLDADPDPVDQAKHFVATVGKLEPGEFAIVDVETKTPANQSGRVKQYLDYVDEHLYGGKPGTWVYASSSYFVEHDLMGFARGSRHTWVAAYGSTEPSVGHTLWQHTDQEQWPGIAKPCDCSIFHGSVDDLHGKLVPAAA